MRSLLPLFLLAFAASGQETAKPAAAGEVENPLFTVTPRQVARGKDYNVVIRDRDKDCLKKPEKDRRLTGVKVDLGSVSGFQAEGGGQGDGDGCFLRFKLSVAEDAPLGPLEIPLLRESDKTSLQPVTLMVMAKERGPIPPGMNPDVDISWKVLPRRAVGDSFGRRVSRLYFGIELTVGNNSGYDLQISNIAFRLPRMPEERPPMPNDGYQVVRASLEREQQIGAHALVVNSIRALGPVLTGVSGFLTPRSVDDFNVFVSIFNNPFEKGVELVWPDRTVRQLIALDNRAVRDSIIVPNNVQQRLLLFVSRELIMCRKVKDNACSENPVTITWKEVERGSKVEKSITLPCRIPYTFDFNPIEIAERLGKLVLIGRHIDYINRVRLVSTEQPAVAAPPIARPNVELKIRQDEKNKEFSVIGASLRQAGITTEIGDIKITDVTRSADGSVVSFKASVDNPDLEPKKYKLYVTTPAGSEVLDIEVQETPPKIDDTKIGEAEDGKRTVTLTGDFLKDVKKVATGEDAKGKIEVIGEASGKIREDGKHVLEFKLTVLSKDAKGTYILRPTRPHGATVNVPIDIK